MALVSPFSRTSYCILHTNVQYQEVLPKKNAPRDDVAKHPFCGILSQLWPEDSLSIWLRKL